MNRNKRHIKYCLLGHGYASLVAYKKLLEYHKPDEILILQKKCSNELFTIDHNHVSFSPLPIFPVLESELYGNGVFKGVPVQDPIKVSFSKLENIELEKLEYKEGSLADFMIKKQGVDKNLCLGMKQWGVCMLEDPLSQVQDKIRRHYISKKRNTRLGYINGKSLYTYVIEGLDPNILRYTELEEIDTVQKLIHVDNQIISFEHLVSTIPLNHLLDLCKLPYAYNTSHAGAYFQFFTYNGGFDENQMIYDCDFNSDIIRIFSITNKLLLAQYGVGTATKVSLVKSKKRILELAPEIKNLVHARDLLLPMCYPLEQINDKVSKESLARLKLHNITTLGRFGNWEYSDLHELEWSFLSKQT